MGSGLLGRPPVELEEEVQEEGVGAEKTRPDVEARKRPWNIRGGQIEKAKKSRDMYISVDLYIGS